MVSAITFGSCSPASAKSAESCRPASPLAALRAQQLDDGGGEGWVGAVDGVQSPVGVDDNDPSTGSGDADELGHGLVRGREVLEDALAQRAVAGRVVERRGW